MTTPEEGASPEDMLNRPEPLASSLSDAMPAPMAEAVPVPSSARDAAPEMPMQPAPSATPYAAAPLPPQAYGAPSATPNTWMNIVSFVTALLGMAIVPIIFGHMGVSAANKGKADLKGLGIAGLIIGYIELAFWIILIAVLVGAALASSS